MELLTVVAILAITASIAVPSVLFIRDSFRMRERNAHARTVYLAAQSRLTQLRSGGMTPFTDCPEAVPQLGEEIPEGYAYAHTGDDWFSLLLPKNSLEAGLQSAQIIVEFSPETGNVRSVFYYEGDRDIVRGYEAGQLPREAKQRRALLLGYWDGSDLPGQRLAEYQVKAEVSFENGQDARITVRVPTQTMASGTLTDITGGDYLSFVEGLEIRLSITGERGGRVETCIKAPGTTENCRPGSTEGGISAVEATALLDSLLWSGSLGGGIAPGDNVSLVAEVTGAPSVTVESAALAGVNPLFGALTADGTGGLLLAVSNGRHLQNLNKLSLILAREVSAVVFLGPEGTVGKGEAILIDWQETSDYYGGLDFTPIDNAPLFGSLSDGEDTDRADIVGNGAVIQNLTVNVDDGDAGLFTCLNTHVDSLYLSAPVIETGAGSAGALAAVVGTNARITNCGSFPDQAEAAVRGTEAAGGLVGIALGGGEVFSRCFATVNAEGKSAGGLVGRAGGVDFAQCYASGTAVGTEAAGGFVGTAADCRFTNCFAAGDAAGLQAVGGFAGVLAADTDIRFHSCYSLGLAIREDLVFENFCGENRGAAAGVSDFYAGCAEAVLAGAELTDYRFKDCYYLAGNCPGAAYDNGASALWASPMDYETLGNIRKSGTTLLSRFRNTPFPDETALEAAKEFLAGLDTDLSDILKNYTGRGSYQIYFDAAKAIFGDKTLEKQYKSKYSAAFPGKVWQIGDDPFPMLKGLPFYGSWPGKTAAGDSGVLYYERLTDGWNIRQVRLSDGRVTARRTGRGQVEAAGYGLYFPAGTLPFSEDTWAMVGDVLEGILPDYEVRTLAAFSMADDAGNPSPLEIAPRYFGKTVTVVPEFADTLNQTGKTYRIRCQSQLESIARYPAGDYMLEGILTLDDSYTSIPTLSGSLTGDGEVVLQGSGGLVDILAGGTLEGIRVSGSVTLSGTAGVLANRVTDGGTIRDCEVAGGINLVDAQIAGPVVGILEDGTILRTCADARMTGMGECVGAFVGQALGGVIRDCTARLPETSMAFAGFAVAEKTGIPEATHFALEKPDSSRVDPAGLEAAASAESVSYNTKFENCMFQSGDTRLDALETRHYYRLSPIGGWKAALWGGGELPQSGRFLLVTGEGQLLLGKNEIIFREDRWDLGSLSEEWLWTGGGSGWTNGGVSVSVGPLAEDTDYVLISYEETAEITGPGESLKTQQRECRVVCQLYEITENTDCRAVHLETVRILRQAGGGAQ